ncbi:hypothetical protein DUNSADRAFT_12453 [Dunaliella salina]|uniref:FAM192A/Fyv6 N-terminal domain-containing protein n=1 Tax=Dunaliella salina TaxID=3046 RepID=A0ABQ7H3V6_DUNSA|nr:hypothetical protein DUNSADRAFT_12453 [Dunaliella salina]|eukprot:KAF5841525.1 hypothetical protein DUNSADRAFT_12453 [Dunaliella salina]
MAHDGKGRFAAREQFDRSAQDDPEYLKVVREIQEGHSRAGWLAGSGAFDREDLAYIKDFKETERQKEQDLHDLEASEFAKLRSSLEDGEAKALAAARAAQRKKEYRHTPKPLPIKIVPQKSKPSRSGSLEPTPEPPHKRIQTSSPQEGPRGASQQPQPEGHPQEQQQGHESELLGLLGDYSSSSPSGSLTGTERKEGQPEVSTAPS